MYNDERMFLVISNITHSFPVSSRVRLVPVSLIEKASDKARVKGRQAVFIESYDFSVQNKCGAPVFGYKDADRFGQEENYRAEDELFIVGENGIIEESSVRFRDKTEHREDGFVRCFGPYRKKKPEEKASDVCLPIFKIDCDMYGRHMEFPLVRVENDVHYVINRYSRSHVLSLNFLSDVSETAYLTKTEQAIYEENGSYFFSPIPEKETSMRVLVIGPKWLINQESELSSRHETKAEAEAAAREWVDKSWYPAEKAQTGQRLEIALSDDLDGYEIQEIMTALTMVRGVASVTEL